MSETLSITTSLATSNIHQFVEAMFQAAARGYRVFIDAKVYEKLSSLFEKIGVQVKEVPPGSIQYSNYILIRSTGGFKVRIEVVENGKTVNTIRTTLNALQSALSKLADRVKNRARNDVPNLYEVIITDEIRKLLESSSGDSE